MLFGWDASSIKIGCGVKKVGCPVGWLYLLICLEKSAPQRQQVMGGWEGLFGERVLLEQ